MSVPPPPVPPRLDDPPGPGLRLRLLREDDLEALLALDADPEVMRHLSDGVPSTRAMYEDFLLERFLSIARREPGHGVLAIEGDGAFLGWAMLRFDGLAPGWREIGYRLRREAWGRGIATWAAARLRDWAFEGLGAATVCARTAPGNLGSRRVMEKIGLAWAGDFTSPRIVFPGGHAYPERAGVLYLRHRAPAPADPAG